MTEVNENKEEKVIEKKDKKEKKRKYHDPKTAVVKVIAAFMAVCMVFAVAATCIFYLQLYI